MAGQGALCSEHSWEGELGTDMGIQWRGLFPEPGIGQNSCSQGNRVVELTLPAWPWETALLQQTTANLPCCGRTPALGQTGNASGSPAE